MGIHTFLFSQTKTYGNSKGNCKFVAKHKRLIAFDKYGNLTPYDIVESNLCEFEKYLVNEMKNNKHRYQLYSSYTNYIQKLNKIIGKDYYQWLNGSFVTKTAKPNDIDVVSFIDHSIVEKYDSEINSFFYPLSKSIHNVDAYIVKTYPNEHSKYKFFKSDNLYWMHQFLKTKPNRAGKLVNKGFIKIDMCHEKLQQQNIKPTKSNS